MNKGDVVIGFSGSGNSENIIEAFKLAKKKRGITVLFSGKTGGKAKDLADISLLVPTDNGDFIEDIHESLGHFCCKMLSKIVRGGKCI